MQDTRRRARRERPARLARRATTIAPTWRSSPASRRPRPRASSWSSWSMNRAVAWSVAALWPRRSSRAWRNARCVCLAYHRMTRPRRLRTSPPSTVVGGAHDDDLGGFAGASGRAGDGDRRVWPATRVVSARGMCSSRIAEALTTATTSCPMPWRPGPSPSSPSVPSSSTCRTWSWTKLDGGSVNLRAALLRCAKPRTRRRRRHRYQRQDHGGVQRCPRGGNDRLHGHAGLGLPAIAVRRRHDDGGSDHAARAAARTQTPRLELPWPWK